MRPLDNTLFRSVVTCHTAAVLRHVHGFSARDAEDAFALRAGSAIHEGLACYFRGNRLPDGTAAAPESVLLDGYGEPTAGRHASYEGYRTFADAAVHPDVAWQQRFTAENVRRVLASWIAAHPLVALPFKVPDPALIEVPFTVPLDEHGDVLLSGRMDGFVTETASGAWRLLENKTTGRVSDRYVESFDLDSQPSHYTFAALAALRERPDLPAFEGMFLNVIELAKLPDSTRECKTHGVPYRECSGLHLKAIIALVRRSPREIDEWCRDALALAATYVRLSAEYATVESIPDVPQQGKFTGACRYCQFFKFCQAGRPTFALDDFLVKDEWSPL